MEKHQGELENPTRKKHGEIYEFLRFSWFSTLTHSNSQPCHRDLKSLHLVVIAFVVIASKMPWLLVKLVILRRLGGKEDSNKNAAFTIFDFRFSEQNGVFVWRYLSWWFRNPANHLRLVIYPTVYYGFHWCSRISEPSTAKFQFFSHSCAKSFVISRDFLGHLQKSKVTFVGVPFRTSFWQGFDLEIDGWKTQEICSI